MAIAHLTPTDDGAADPAPAPQDAPQDLVTFTEAVLLFRQIDRDEFKGRPLTVLRRKLQRWARQDGLHTERRGQDTLVSFSDLIRSHARRYPPGHP